MPDENGYCALLQEPATPGDAFYKFRDILSGTTPTASWSEHNPANLRYTKHRRTPHRTPGPRVEQRGPNAGRKCLVPGPAQHRPSLGAHSQASSSYLRKKLGWKVERDALKVLIEEHLCAVCEGAGLSYRLMADHPRDVNGKDGLTPSYASLWTVT